MSQPDDREIPTHDKSETQSISESENPVIAAPTPKLDRRPQSNRDWWPNQLNLQVLHQHSPRAVPAGRRLRLRRRVRHGSTSRR